jgi:hypothetical protein
MTEPKSLIYNILSGISGVTVYQNRPDILERIPCITFYVGGNTPEYVLEKELSHQEIEVIIDIYANTSKESGELLTTLESEMLDNYYRMTFCSDVPDDDYSHITTRFNIII